MTTWQYQGRDSIVPKIAALKNELINILISTIQAELSDVNIHKYLTFSTKHQGLQIKGKSTMQAQCSG